MSDVIAEWSASILRIQRNRPEKKNAMTSGMYLTLADMLNSAAKDRPDKGRSLARCRGFVLRWQRH